MILNKRRFATLSFILFFMQLAYSQSIGNSPYSRYGIGDIIPEGNIRNQGMGGAAIGSPDIRFINYVNPATLTSNKVVSFEGGVLYQNKRIRSNLESQKTNGSLPFYALFAFPITNKWTTSFGLRPSSVISFERNYSEEVVGDSATSLVIEESGEGGINKIFLGNGIQVSKSLSLGGELSYDFGRRQVESKFGLGSIDVINQNVLYRRENIRGFNLKFGAFYKVKLDSGGKTSLGIGATYRSALSHKSDIFISRQLQQNTIILTQDTFDIYGGTFQMPSEIALGFSLKRVNKWTLSFDVLYTTWSEFSATYQNPVSKDVLNYKLGLEWVPNYRSVSNVFSRSIYRAGFHFSPYEFDVSGQSFNEFGTNFGLSLPVNKINYLNLGVDIGRRGTLENNLILENFARISLGLTINDPTWFRRYKLD
jgi:hypothetical protein